MSLEQKDDLEREMRSKVLSELRGDHALAELILFTLRNFAYRYMESSTTGTLEPRIEEGRIFVVQATETNTMEALKASDQKTKNALIEKAKAKGKEGIVVDYSLSIRMLSTDQQGGGIFALQANISCDGVINKKEATCEYEDVIDIRNKLAKDLEDICTIF